MAEKMFDGFDHTQYREEVQQRWGKDAYAAGDAWWRGMGNGGEGGLGGSGPGSLARLDGGGKVGRPGRQRARPRSWPGATSNG